MPSQIIEKLGIEFDELHPRYLQLIEKALEIAGNGFFTMPGSTKYHHNYKGGLKDHSVDVNKLSMIMANHFQSKVDTNVVDVGSTLHDVGKARHYQDNILKSGAISEKVPYKRTDISKQLEHIGEGFLIIQEAAKELKFPKAKLNPILHVVGSHHGDVRRGWGSLIDPQTPEAHIVHHADMLSSRIQPKPEKGKAKRR